jgi:hypothetical protein
MLLSPSPSIDELLANLQGGPQGGPPAPASLQNMQPGPLPPGLLGLPPAGQPTSVTGNSMGDKIHRFLVNHVVGNAPAGVGAIATPEEIAAARPGIGETFAKRMFAGGSDLWKQNILDAEGMKQIAQSAGERTRVLAARQNMMVAFPSRPGETQAEMNDRLEAMLMYSAQHGDLEMVNAIKDVVKETAKTPHQPPAREPMQIHGVIAGPESKFAGQTVTQLMDADTRKIIAEMPDGASPMSEDAKAFRQAALDASAESRALLTKSREDNLDAGQVRLFQTQHTQLLQNAQKFARFLPTLEQAKQGNPAAVAPLLYGMVSNTDLNAQMRQGILQLLEMPAGALNRGELWFTQHVSGKLDPKMISNIENLVRAAHGTDVQEYTKFWDRAVKANPRLASHPDMMPPEELFKIPGAAGASAQQGAARIRQFLPQR